MPKLATQRVTIRDLSRTAGLSKATVSRALNPHTRHRVAERTRRRVDALAQQLGYTVNVAARHLASASCRTIGVVCSHAQGLFASPYHVQILSGVSDALVDTPYLFKLILLRCGSPRWDRYDFRAGEAVDGLIVTHWRSFFSSPKVLGRLGVPCVVVSDPEPGLQAYCVSGDHLLGGELAARHLYAKGHRRIAVLTGPADSYDSRLRVHGFRRFLRRQDAGVHVMPLSGEFQREQARMVAMNFLRKRPDAVTAAFCCNDAMALGVLDALRQLGLSCPRDVSIVGYDDDPAAATSQPSLTTIRVPLYEVARDGTERLVRYLDQRQPKDFAGGQTLLPVMLLERSSVRQVK